MRKRGNGGLYTRLGICNRRIQGKMQVGPSSFRRYRDAASLVTFSLSLSFLRCQCAVTLTQSALPTPTVTDWTVQDLPPRVLRIEGLPFTPEQETASNNARTRLELGPRTVAFSLAPNSMMIPELMKTSIQIPRLGYVVRSPSPEVQNV